MKRIEKGFTWKLNREPTVCEYSSDNIVVFERYVVINEDTLKFEVIHNDESNQTLKISN